MSNKAILSPFAALSLEKRIFIYLTNKNVLERLKIAFVHKQYGRIAYIHVYVYLLFCYILHKRISKYLKINTFGEKAAKSPRYYNPLFLFRLFLNNHFRCLYVCLFRMILNSVLFL